MINFSAAQIRNAIAAIENKKTIAEFINDQKIINEVRIEKALIIAEVCNNDSVIRARFNDLLSKQ